MAWGSSASTRMRQVSGLDVSNRQIANKGENTMSEEIRPVEMSAEEIRLRERSSFDAFNEAQASMRQIRRDKGKLASGEENKRWERPEARSNSVTSGVDKIGQDTTPAG
jgi:hypothetical protein